MGGTVLNSPVYILIRLNGPIGFHELSSVMAQTENPYRRHSSDTAREMLVDNQNKRFSGITLIVMTEGLTTSPGCNPNGTWRAL